MRGHVHLSAQPDMAGGGKQSRDRLRGVAMYTASIIIDRENAVKSRE